MPDKIRVTSADNNRRVAIRMKDTRPVNVAETRARIRVSEKASRETGNGTKVVLKKAEPREAVNAIRTSNSKHC
jgi:hypothetical protein